MSPQPKDYPDPNIALKRLVLAICVILLFLGIYFRYPHLFLVILIASVIVGFLAMVTAEVFRK